MMGSGRILVVDDEPSLLGVLQRYLTRLGYDVVTALGGEEAYRALQAEPASFSAVLADLSLPDIPCTELLSRMLLLNPSLGLLICSGSDLDVASLSADLRNRVTFLRKPFLPRALAETIEGILRQRGAAGA